MSTIVGSNARNATFVMCDCHHEILGFFRQRTNSGYYLSCFALNENKGKDKAFDFYFDSAADAVHFANALIEIAHTEEKGFRREYRDVFSDKVVNGTLVLSLDVGIVLIQKFAGDNLKPKPTWELTIDKRSAMLFGANILEEIERRS